jgi:RimJ/RimL family protein N-acetyltransferase
MSRVRDALASEGIGGLLRRAAAWVRRKAGNAFDQVWYVLELNRVEPRELAEGYELVLAGPREVELVARLVKDALAEQFARAEASDTPSATPQAMDAPGFTDSETRRRLDQGAQLWTVVKGDEAAFACWIFPRVTPVLQARGGTYTLPEGTACLEDSVTSPNHRGRGIAPAAWTAIAQRLSAQGFEILITKVNVENVPSRRAVEKSGFRGVNVMRYKRRGPLARVRFDPLPAGESGEADATDRERAIGAELARGLER